MNPTIEKASIFLKDGCFLPDSLVVHKAHQVKFINDDSQSFIIQCKGSFGIPSFRLESNGFHVISFPKSGKFQFTSSSNASLKCIVEVLESETKKMRTKPLLLSGSLGKSAEGMWSRKNENPSYNLLKKSRVNVTFSPVHDSEDEMEEVNHIRSQRSLFKSFKSADGLSHSVGIAERGTTGDEHSSQINLDSSFTAEEHVIAIEDFDFNVHSCSVYVGDKLTFVLSPSVPLHAEHIIYGTSSCSELNFESDVLQTNECTSYSFEPKASGELKVSCKIYHEMQCVIDVRPNTRRMKTISMDDSGITAVALNSIDSPATNEPCRSSSPDSFYDSDDVLSNESGDDEEAGHLITIGQQPSSISHTLLVGNSGDPQDIGDIDLVDIIRHVSPVDQCQPAPEQKLRSVSVYIDEYSFRPDTLKCKVGCIVQFLLAPNSAGCRISCDGEFSGIEISPSNAKYLHNFEKGRVYEVYNEVMNFITCRLEVGDHDVAAILPSASPTPHENHNQAANHSPGDKESLPMKLFGSFIPIKPTPVVEISAVDDDDLSVMTLLSGRVRVDSASLSSSDDGFGFKSEEENDGDVDETAADLESCTEGLSRAAKKRLKYKLRVKKRKQENQEQKEIGPITEGEALSASVGKKKSNKKKKKKASTKNSDHSLAQSQSEPVSSSPKIGDVVDLPPPYASMTGVETNISDSVGLPTVLVNGDLVATMSPLRPASYTLATTDWSEDIDIEEEDEIHSQSGLQSPPPYAALVTQSNLESSSSLLRKDASLPAKELETTETEDGDSHQHGTDDFGEEIGSDVDSLRAANGVYDNGTVSSASTDSFEDLTGHIALDDVTSILVRKDNHEIHSNDLDSNAPAANDADSIVSELGESDDEIDHSEPVVALNDSISIPVDTIGVATTFQKRSILLSALGLKQEAVPTPAPASIPPITAPTSTPVSVAQTKYDAGKVVAISSVKFDALSVPIASDAGATSANGRAKIDGSKATETTSDAAPKSVLSTRSTANSKSADTATASATKASVDTKDIAPPKPSPTLVDVVKGTNKSTKASLVPFNATEVASEAAAESKVVAPSTSSVISPKSPVIASSQVSNTSSMSSTKATAAETSAPPIQIRTSNSDTTSGLPLSSKSSMSTHQIPVSDVVQQAAVVPKAVSIPTGQVSEKDIPKKGAKGKKAKPIEPVNSKTEVKEVDDVPKPAVVVSTTKASLDAPVATLAHSPSADESTDVYNEANDEIIQLLLQRLAEAERMADNQLTETLPRGKVVGVFRYESLPFHKTVEKTATTDTPRSVSTGVTSLCATPQDSPVDGSTIVTPSPERPPTARNPAKSKAKPVPASLRPIEFSQKSDELHSRSTSDVIKNPNASVGATPSSVRPGKDSNMRYRGNRHKNKETS